MVKKTESTAHRIAERIPLIIGEALGKNFLPVPDVFPTSVTSRLESAPQKYILELGHIYSV